MTFILTDSLLSLCRQLYEKFNTIYEVSQDTGRLVIPSFEMETKVFEWLANASTALEDVASQVNMQICACKPIYSVSDVITS